MGTLPVVRLSVRFRSALLGSSFAAYLPRDRGTTATDGAIFPPSAASLLCLTLPPAEG